MAVKATPQSAAGDWATRLAGAGDKITRGVQAVSVAPGQRAVQKKAKMVQNWTDAINNGKWERNTAAVGLEEWRSDMINKGIPRIGQGANAAKTKMENFYGKFFPFLNQVAAQIDSMPDVTLEDRIAKAAAQMRAVSKFQG